ncbi:MAG: hypothetical protein U9N59_08160 [Campylobacterota bacterium]|nr:hypothetical protein [Campylobacterota bacterium]
MKKSIILIILALLVSGCAIKSVRQQDLNSWVGMPVEALDTHSLFLTLPVIKTITKSGIEIRVYPNKRNFGSCFGGGNLNSSRYLSYASFNSYQSCSSGLVGCDNIFYIKDDKVIEYKPVGRCYTDKTVQPEKRYWELLNHE